MCFTAEIFLESKSLPGSVYAGSWFSGKTIQFFRKTFEFSRIHQFIERSYPLCRNRVADLFGGRIHIVGIRVTGQLRKTSVKETHVLRRAGD
jgi:hypothetical protein